MDAAPAAAGALASKTLSVCGESEKFSEKCMAVGTARTRSDCKNRTCAARLGLTVTAHGLRAGRLATGRRSARAKVRAEAAAPPPGGAWGEPARERPGLGRRPSGAAMPRAL